MKVVKKKGKKNEKETAQIYSINTQKTKRFIVSKGKMKYIHKMVRQMKKNKNKAKNLASPIIIFPNSMNLQQRLSQLLLKKFQANY